MTRAALRLVLGTAALAWVMGGGLALMLLASGVISP